MVRNNFRSKFQVCLVGLVFISGCSNSARRVASPAPGRAAEAPPAPAPADIPATSPLASIHKGMGMAAVFNIMGSPSDQCGHITGKSFIPFYFGGDARRSELHYKGQGRVILSSGGFQGSHVSAVEYDPSESGYCGRRAAPAVRSQSQDKPPQSPGQAMTMAQAQAELKKRGFDVGQPDGVYGPRTRAALINFRRAVGIVETGELDSNTIAALSK